MYCDNCGTKIESKANFCTECGKKIEDTNNDSLPFLKNEISEGTQKDNNNFDINSSSNTTEISKNTNISLPILEKNQIPREQASKLISDEIPHHFSYIDLKGGGCLSTSSAKQWILITSERILFEAAVKDGRGDKVDFIHRSGFIPINKVSYVGTSTTQISEGCSNKKFTSLLINSSGGEVDLAIPTQDEANRIQEVIDAIISKK